MDRPSALALWVLALLFMGSIGSAPYRGGPPGLASESAANLAAPRSVWANLSPVADATIAAAFPNRNFGAADGLSIAADPANGAAARALLRADLGSIPATSLVINATLRVYVENATAALGVEAHRILAPWSEGNGVDYLYDRPVTVTETAGIARTREPVEASIVLGTPMALSPKADFRVFDTAGTEVPSQVTRVAATGANVTAVTVVFESSNRPLEARTYHVHYGYAFPVIPAYRQRIPWTELWNVTAGTTYASLAAADLNGDGLLETILGSTDGNVYAIRANGSILWTAPLGAPIDAPVAVADVNGDGSLDVLALTDSAANHRIYALNSTGQSIWPAGAGALGKPAQGPLVVADVNGDGIKEIFAGATDRTIYAFNGSTGGTMWTFGLGPGQQAYGGALENFYGGPAPELIFGTSTGVLQALNTTGTAIWNFQPGSNSMLQTPAVADIDGDGSVEIVAGDRAASGNEFAVWGGNSTTKWSRSTGTDQSGGNLIVDFGDDGQLETVFAKTTAGQIGVLDSNGRWLWNYTTGGTIYSVPAAADLNGDGEEDIAIGSFDNFLYLIASNNTLIRKIPTDSPVRGTPVIADIDGDGTLDIVFATATHTYAYQTASLGHDSRVGAYNLRNTGHFLDGNSPDGVNLLSVAVGFEQTLSGIGVTWLSRDGTTPWTTAGSESNATADSSGSLTSGAWASLDLTGIVRKWVRNDYPNLGVVLRLSDEGVNAWALLSSRESGGLGPILRVVFSTTFGPRIVSRIPDQVVPEDSPPWTLNLVGFASDPGTPLSDLSWDLAGANSSMYDYSGGNVTGNHLITFEPKPNAYGNNRVTVFLFDKAGLYDTQPMWVNLTPVNDPPVFTPPTTFYVHYDAPYTFNFTPYMSDPDNSLDQLYLTVSDPGHATVAGHNVTFRYEQSLINTWQFVTLTVSDGTASTARTVAVRVTSDYPPVLRRSLPDVTIREGDPPTRVFDLDDYFFDPDNDTLFYTFGFSHLQITVHERDPQPLNHTVDISAIGQWWGTESVTFRATDPTGALLEDSILVTVIPVNDPPTITGVPGLTVHYNAPYSFDLTPYIYDPDTPIEQITVSTSDPIDVTVSGRVIMLLYPDIGVPTYTRALVLNVTDGLNYSLAWIGVTVTNDYPPVLLKTLPDVVFLEDTVAADRFNLADYFRDNDSATVFYSSGQVHVNVTIKADHNVTFSAEANWNGLELVRFRATDDKGALAEDTIKVIVQPVDDAPLFSQPIPDQTTDAHSWFLDLGPYVSDVDTNASLLVASVVSSAGNGYVQVAGLKLLFGYPNDVNADSVTIRVTDDYGLSVTQTIQVRIRGPDVLGIVLPWIAAAVVAAATILVWRRVRPEIEEVFLVHANGLPIAHLSRTLKSEKDTDLVTSMFTAIQNFTNDTFRARGAGDLNALQLGDYRLSVARGTSAFLVVLYHGRQSGRVERKAHEVVEELEAHYGSVLANWNGDVDQLAGVKKSLEEFFDVEASAVLEPKPVRRLGGRGGLGRSGSSEDASEPPEPPVPLPPPPPPG